MSYLNALFLLFLFTGCTQSPSQSRSYSYYSPIKETQPIAYPTPPLRYKGLIVIDPGHGGDDEGTKSHVRPIYSEKSFNLTTSRFLSRYLRDMGYTTVLTREKDIFIPLKERARIANNLNTLLFVSVHYNSAPSPDAHGVEIFYYNDKEKERTELSKALAKTILSEILIETKAKSRGVKHGNYAVIRETSMPAVLIEGGFLSNGEELEKIKDPKYLKKMAYAVAKGIDKYIRSSSGAKKS